MYSKQYAKALEHNSNPLWYSHLIKVLESGKIPKNATPEHIRNALLKSGVKPEELKFSGVDKYLSTTEKVDVPDIIKAVKNPPIREQWKDEVEPVQPVPDLRIHDWDVHDKEPDDWNKEEHGDWENDDPDVTYHITDKNTGRKYTMHYDSDGREYTVTDDMGDELNTYSAVRRGDTQERRDQILGHLEEQIAEQDKEEKPDEEKSQWGNTYTP